MIIWDNLTEEQKNELIAKEILRWEKRNDIWYKSTISQTEEVISTLPQFATDFTTLHLILEQFDTYQITKMFPLKYRTIIRSNKNVAYSHYINDSVCKAALKATGINVI